MTSDKRKSSGATNGKRDAAISSGHSVTEEKKETASGKTPPSPAGPQETPQQAKRRWAPLSQWLIALVPALAVIVIDQISKLVVTKNIPLNSTVTLIPDVLNLTFVRNFHGIFSLNYGPRFMYILLPLLALCFVAFLIAKPQTRFMTVLLGMILGGGLGNNLIDRLRLGYVVDWISMGFKNWRWATYNLADLSVIFAVTLLLIVELFFSKSTRDKKSAENL